MVAGHAGEIAVSGVDAILVVATGAVHALTVATNRPVVTISIAATLGAEGAETGLLLGAAEPSVAAVVRDTGTTLARQAEPRLRIGADLATLGAKALASEVLADGAAVAFVIGAALIGGEAGWCAGLIMAAVGCGARATESDPGERPSSGTESRSYRVGATLPLETSED